MELNKYQEVAMSTCLETSANWSYAAGLLHEEAGELQGKVDKAIRNGKAVINNNHLYLLGDPSEQAEFNIELKKELGDVLWAVAVIAAVKGWDLESVAQMNVDKLADRKRRDKINGNGDNR